MKKTSKEHAFPYLLKAGGLFFALGGMISGIMSVAVMSVESFFHIKRRVEGGRYVELKIKNRKN